jgi:hypothetical protein
MIMPLKPEPGYVPLVILAFFGVGAWVYIKGLEINNIGTKAFGGWLVICGLYYSLQWFQAKRKDDLKE